MSKIKNFFLIFFLFITINASAVESPYLYISVANIANPGHVDFAQAMAEVYNSYGHGKFTFEIFPFLRSIENVVLGKADAHMPLIKINQWNKSKGYRFSTDHYVKVVFVAYSNRNKKLTSNDLLEAKYSLSNKAIIHYKLQTIAKKLEKIVNVKFNSRKELQDELHNKLTEAEYNQFHYSIELAAYPYQVGSADFDRFDFPNISVPTAEAALTMVNTGRLDAYILAQEDCDQLIKKNKFKNIHRSFYKIYPVHFIVRDNEQGKATDLLLTRILNDMKKSGAFTKYSSAIHEKKFLEWQPY